MTNLRKIHTRMCNIWNTGQRAGENILYIISKLESCLRFNFGFSLGLRYTVKSKFSVNVRC